jgi:hypothetical protein
MAAESCIAKKRAGNADMFELRACHALNPDFGR